jgi:hypothetical protein
VHLKLNYEITSGSAKSVGAHCSTFRDFHINDLIVIIAQNRLQTEMRSYKSKTNTSTTKRDSTTGLKETLLK